jgi:hypothetical protein
MARSEPMRFLTRYTPTDAPKGSPSPETMAKMKNFAEECIKSGVLIATGGIMPNAANGMRIKLANGAFEVRSAPSSVAQHAGGWAILNVNSPEHLKEMARRFLEASGDGDVEVMEINQLPIP